ncbi:MAG TPA: CHAD domain-containing protein [Burkholderiales bacterium]|nr:CHAD domain-containing protein [Burkholderiales bacterium]
MDALDERLIRVSGAGIRREHGEARPGEAGPVKADYRVVEAWMTPLEAFRALCAVCVRHLEGNRYGALATADPEYLHQIRVALRRLRTAFDVFADALPVDAAAELLGELRWLRRALGGARDWDVFLAGTLKPALARHPRHAGLRSIRAACEDSIAEARTASRRALESRRYYALMRALRALSYGDAPLPSRAAGAARPPQLRRHALAAIAALIGKARKRGRRLARLDAAELHRLRKAVRRLRYGLLFLAPLLPEARVRPLAAAVEAMQETLGVLNDCAVGETLIERARAEARGPKRRKARKLLAKRIAEARAAGRGQLEAQWRAFRAAQEEWASVESG